MRRPAYFVVLKKLSFLAFGLFLLTALGGCQPGGVDPPATGSARSMKGFELYSWQAGKAASLPSDRDGQWYFALVVGTNRIKTYEEITSSEVRVEGLEALKRELDQLARGEQVFWSEGRVPNMALPPDNVIREVRAYCQQRGIRLEVQAGVSFFEPPLPTQTGLAAQATQTVPTALTPAPSSNANWVRYPSLNEVRSLAFAPDGALWAATGGGVVRWDLTADTCVRYGTADGLASEDITALAFAPDGAPSEWRLLRESGTLWVATRGGGVSRFDGEDWLTYTEADGLVDDIAFTPDGAAWVATGFTLARFDGASWTHYDRLANSLAVAPDGAIWVNGWEGRQGSQYVARFDGQNWTTYQSTDSYPGGFIVGAVTADGLVWGVDSERRTICRGRVRPARSSAGPRNTHRFDQL